jgi:DivIVA domain-containing protein
MPLTPEDVANKQFTSTRLGRGYDEQEVDDFLDEVEAELTRLYRENEELRAKLAAAQRAGRGRPAPAGAPPGPGPGSGAGTGRRAGAPAASAPPPPAPAPVVSSAGPAEAAAGILAMAQKTANEHVAEARSQAERIIGEARAKADQLSRDAEDKHRQTLGSLEAQRHDLERRIDELRAFEREYRTRLKSYLEGQLRELEGRNSDGGPRSAPNANANANATAPGLSLANATTGSHALPQNSPQPTPSRPSPFAPANPVGSHHGDGPSGPPQQAGYIIDEGPEPRG